MENKGKIQRQIEKAKETMKEWPAWMQRTARFEGRDSDQDAMRDKQDDNTKNQKVTK